MKEPVTVSAPIMTSKPSAAIVTRGIATASPAPSGDRRCRYSATPTSVAARAPNMSEIAIRCGIAVMGTRVPRG